MTNPIGLLTAADEGLGHQIVDTFAVTGTSDLSWTEKICAMAAARDGSLQLGFGLGRYNNRNVMDAYAGTSRGVEQITVRASRSLGTDPLTAVIGPIHYEIVEPLRQIRFVLEPNDTQPIAFDWLFEGAFPPAFEHRNLQRTSNRISADLVRYHQIGRCSGWVEIDGTRTEMHTRHVGVDARPLLGRALRHRPTRPGRRAPRRHRQLPLLLDTELPRTTRRLGLRDLHGVQPLPQARI